MAGEIESGGPGTGKTVYSLIYQTSTGKIWNNNTNLFETYNNANYANYVVSLTEQGASNYYVGNFPAAIAAGTYSVHARNQLTGGGLQSDPIIATGNVEWNGAAPAALSDTATSGFLGQFNPIRIARGTMIKPFPVKLVGSADHVSPLVSGIVSGQISRDGGAFGPLQSGAFTEVGLGWYSLQALTSGDLLCNAAALVFTAVGVSGGQADQRDIGLITQRTSGQ